MKDYKTGCVYLLTKDDKFKIGISEYPNHRRRTLETVWGEFDEDSHYYEMSKELIIKVEKSFHKIFQDYNMKFDCRKDGYTEFFDKTIFNECEKHMSLLTNIFDIKRQNFRSEKRNISLPKNKISVKQYCELYNVSKPTVYERIRSEKIKSVFENKRRYILIDSNECYDNRLINEQADEILKQEIKRLNEELTFKNNEIINLYEEIIRIERSHRNEIIEIYKKSDKTIAEYLTVIDKN